MNFFNVRLLNTTHTTVQGGGYTIEWALVVPWITRENILLMFLVYRVDHKVGQFFFKESNFQIVRVFCTTKIYILIFDTF
jgi:hypothetical protein